METDIAEGGHILSIGPMEAIREPNRRQEPYKEKGRKLLVGGGRRISDCLPRRKSFPELARM